MSISIKKNTLFFINNNKSLWSYLALLVLISDNSHISVFSPRSSSWITNNPVVNSIFWSITNSSNSMIDVWQRLAFIIVQNSAWIRHERRIFGRSADRRNSVLCNFFFEIVFIFPFNADEPCYFSDSFCKIIWTWSICCSIRIIIFWVKLSIIGLILRNL